VIAAVGVDPAIMGVGPAVAIPAAVEKVRKGLLSLFVNFVMLGVLLLWAWTQLSWVWGLQWPFQRARR
jgi:hypothetical protein